MRFVIFLFMFSCGMDTQIVGVVNKSEDSGSRPSQIDSVVDTSHPEDTDHPVDTQSPTLDGVVGYINYSLQQLACPECMGVSQGVSLKFSAQFHEPISDSHTRWIPAPGNCVENLQETVPSISPIDVGSQLTVSGPIHTFPVPRAGSSYQNESIYETQYDRDSVHNVSSDLLLDGFSFNSVRGFDYIEPESLLYVNMEAAYQAPISRSGTTFYWGPSGSGENFMIIVAVYTSTGSALLGYVTCVSEDVGYMVIPGAYLSAYPPGSITAVHMSRQRIELSPSPDLGGYIETHMEWEVVGTGYIE